MTLYFAYGSNMSRPLMRARCALAAALGPAQLAGWRFIINGDGYASVVPSPGSTVFGVLWQLTARDLAALNAYESLATGLYRLRVLPVRHHRRVVRALVYVGRNRSAGRPRSGYHAGVVIPAARDWDLPEAYLAELERWSQTAWRGTWRREPGAKR